jgi:hypothetical protein
MIFQAKYGLAHWATVVIRAKDVHEAFLLAAEHGKEYIGGDVGEIVIEPIDPEGESAVLIEDWS